MKRSRSITFRLTLFFSTASTLVLMVIGYWVGAAVETHFEEQDVHEFEGKLALVRHTLSKVHSPNDLDAATQRLDDALVGHHGLSVSVIWPGKRMLFATPDAALLAPLLNDRADREATGSPKPRVWLQDGQTYRGIVATAASEIPGAPLFTVALALNIGHHLEFLAAFRQSLWLAVAIGILLTGLLGWVAARRGLVPVRDMARVAHGISASRLESRLTLDSVPVELVELASGFNAMLARLEDSFRRLSDFSSDLAHELRTPISNLMTQTEVALSRARSAEEYREVLYSNLEEYDRLARMIGDMLFLAKADNGLIVPRSEPIDLAEEVRQLFEFYEALSEEQGVRLALAGEAVVQGDRLMLRRALGNLLSNALRHTPRSGTIEVRIDRPAPGRIRLAIENPGETIPPEHLPRLFDRFYRADASRHRSHEGAGLGLAITRSIVEAHGGTIAVASANGLTRFEMAFPAVTPP
ncbi:MAG: heavy metal sensor histidine kinase [Denitratisoma sp.]|nr:heavy metal sensor histidine kinase [Denitratisoma sp.]